MELAGGVLAEADELADRLHRRPAAGDADHRAEHAKLRAAVAILGVERVADEAAVAGSVWLPAAERADLGLELADRGRDQREMRARAMVGHDQAGREIVAAVEHQVDAGEQIRDVPRAEPRVRTLEADGGIEP